MPSSIVGPHGYSRADRRAWRAAFTGKTPFSNDTIQRLTGTAWCVLHELAWLESCSRRDRPDQAPLVQCSQSYLANKCGVTRETINRCVNKILEPLGLVVKIWRRQNAKTHEWQTCLYFVTRECKFLLGRIINRLSSSVRSKRVMNTSLKPTARTTSSVRLGQLMRDFTRRE